MVVPMLQAVPFLVWLVLLIFCLIEIDSTPDAHIRGLAAPWWLLVVVLVPVLGSVAWIVAGRPRRSLPLPAARAVAPQVAAAAAERPQPVLPAAPGSAGLADLDRALRAELERIDCEFEEAVRRRRERMRGGDAQPRG